MAGSDVVGTLNDCMIWRCYGHCSHAVQQHSWWPSNHCGSLTPAERPWADLAGPRAAGAGLPAHWISGLMGGSGCMVPAERPWN